MLSAMRVMAFFREENQKGWQWRKEGKIEKQTRKKTHPSHWLVSLPLTDHFQLFENGLGWKKDSSRVWSETAQEL